MRHENRGRGGEQLTVTGQERRLKGREVRAVEIGRGGLIGMKGMVGDIGCEVIM